MDWIEQKAINLINGVGCAGGCMGADDIAEAIRAAIATERAACGERLARVQAEANAIANVLDERRITDFADDVRMLARLADHETGHDSTTPPSIKTAEGSDASAARAAMKCCETCAWVTDQRDPDEDEPSYRCGYPVPFWVPLPTLDYGSWVHADSGAECRAHKPKQ